MEKTEQKTNKNSAAIGEMFKAGLSFGHKSSKLHPKMKPFTSKVKDGVQLIDLDITLNKLEEALSFLKEAKKEGKTFLFIGTNPSLRLIIKEVAENAGAFYVTERWIGGALTNFSEIKKRLKYFNDLEQKIKSDDFSSKYNKKERLEINREFERLKQKFGGIKTMEKLPDVVFITDLSRDDIALREAVDTKRKIVAIVDTNVDPSMIDYMIPANDDAVSSVKYILDKIAKAIK